MFLGRIIFFSFLILTLTGCSRNAATVNGNSISDSDISQIVSAQEQLMGQISKDQEKAIRTNVIQKVVDQYLLLHEAQKEGITVTEEEVSQKYSETKKAWDSNTEMRRSLEAQGYTESNLKEQIKDQLTIEALARKNIDLTDEKIREYYRNHIYEFSSFTLVRDNNKPEIIPFQQLPYDIQQLIRSGEDILSKVQIIKGTSFLIQSIKSPSFDEIKDIVKQKTYDEQQILVTQKMISDLRNKAKIQVN